MRKKTYVFLRALHSKTQKTKNTHNNRLMKVTQIGSLGLEMLFSFVFFSKNFEWFGTHISLQGLLQSALLGIWREPRIMKYYWETHEHCTLGLCRFVKIPFQISWKLHSHIGLKEQTQSFPTLCKGGLQKLKKHRKKNAKKNNIQRVLAGTPPFQRVWIFCFLLFIFCFFRCFFLGFASPPCRCVGKDGFRSYGSAVFVLMVLFFSPMGVQFM